MKSLPEWAVWLVAAVFFIEFTAIIWHDWWSDKRNKPNLFTTPEMLDRVSKREAKP